MNFLGKKNKFEMSDTYRERGPDHNESLNVGIDYLFLLGSQMDVSTPLAYVGFKEERFSRFTDTSVAGVCNFLKERSKSFTFVFSGPKFVSLDLSSRFHFLSL